MTTNATVSSPATDTAVIEDRRSHIREDAARQFSIFDLNGAELLSGTADNVCSGGLHVTVESDIALAVGKRCEVRLAPLLGWPKAESFIEGCYATVVRTRTPPGSDHLGVGLRFDQPLIL